MFENDDIKLFHNSRSYQLLDATNFIDIMIILLIFLMATTTFAKLGIPLHQPKSKYVTQYQAPSIRIDVKKAGDLFYDGQPIETAALTTLIKSKITQSPDTICVISTDKGTETQTLFDVMDLCKQAGAEKFSFSAQKR